MALLNNINELIGKTPLIKINKLNKGSANIYAKLESANPFSSVKDRLALAMIEKAEKEGKINKNTIIIEPTSGNTGVGLAAVCAVKGYKIILTMPETMSLERRKLLKAYGAELVLTDGKSGMNGAIAKAEKIAKSEPNSFIPQQFENLANVEIHKLTTGPEIWEDLKGSVDIFISAFGTGGTLTGAGGYLKSKNPALKIVAVEPKDSAVLSGGNAGPHKIQGIGAGFIPKILDKSLVDEIYLTDEKKAGVTARNAAKKEGLLIGISSGAALEAAITLSNKNENFGKNIVVILPDSGERYLSTWLYD